MKEYLYNFSSLKDSELDHRILKINKMIDYNISLGHSDQLPQLYDLRESLTNEYTRRMSSKKVTENKRVRNKPVAKEAKDDGVIEIGSIEKDNNNDRPSW